MLATLIQATGSTEFLLTEAIKILGPAGLLVVMLIKQLDECKKERIQTQEIFNNLLIKQGETATELAKVRAEADIAAAMVLTDINSSMKTVITEIQNDRREFLEAIHELHDDTLAIFRELSDGNTRYQRSRTDRPEPS